MGNEGVESSDTENHHHLNFPHSYPGTEGCQATCEGHAFTQEECKALFFCEWDQGACYSAVGPEPCPNTPQEKSMRWLDYDSDPGAWVMYPGTDGCENVCESEAIDEATCANMFFCVWDQDKFWSGVGPNNCPDTQEELDQMMK